MKSFYYLFTALAMLTVASGCSGDDPLPNQPGIKDADENSYKTVTIGNHEWFAENLKVSKTLSGVDIPLILDDEEWASAEGPAYTYLDNDQSTYGLLYNGHAAALNELCPEGWRVSYRRYVRSPKHIGRAIWGGRCGNERHGLMAV